MRGVLGRDRAGAAGGELPGEGAGIAEGGCWWAVLVDLVKGMESHREAVLVLDNLLPYI